jgi:hypothetical protein
MDVRAVLAGWPTYGLISLLAGLVLGLIGPFGTFRDLGLAARIGYWLASVPGTAEVLLLELALRRPIAAADWPAIYLYVLLLTAAITVPVALWRRQRSVQAAPSLPPGPAGEALLRRLKPEARGALWALEMEDHYLRVHTSAGNDLILYRLNDALAEVAGLDGRQVHRSYWVAREAVATTERDGRRRLLVLKNGLKVPVSRANLSELRGAGWPT